MKRICNNSAVRMLSLLVQVTLISGIAAAQAPHQKQSNGTAVVPAEAKERLKAIYEGEDFRAESFRAQWLPDASGYLLLEGDPPAAAQAIVHYDVIHGERTELVTTAQLMNPEADGSPVIEDYVISPDGSRILIQTSSQEEANGQRQDWMLDRKSGKLEKVAAGRNNSISPAGKQILFTEEGNLYVNDLKNGMTVPLTRDGVVGSVSNGRAVWSPDGSRIAFVRSDVSGVRLRSALDPGDPSYPEISETRFARVGETIAALRIGVVDAGGKVTRWLSIPIPSAGYYLGEVSWAGNSDELLVEKRSRFRDQREFLLANVNSGEITVIYEESDPAWVVASYRKNAGLEWIDDFSKFLVLTEKDGWRHAYVCSRDRENEQLLTPGAFDIIERVAVDVARGWFYYNASPGNGTRKYLFRVRLDGTGDPERLTPMDQPGTHDYQLSPDARWAFHTYSSTESPPVTELITLPEHEVVRMLEDNRALRERMESMNLQPKEFLQLDIGDGIVMDAWMIKPMDFDPSRKYPVFVYVYGEPHAQTVRDAWGHAMTHYHRVIADLGYLVVSMDNRGTPCPKGAAWRRAVSGSLGPLSTEEQAAGLIELGRTRPYVDLTRVGIWGWSGGGSNTLNAMFRKPDVYHLGIAVAPKPQPHLYNAWFQEIYMKTPEVNPQGYRESAPINFAEGLRGDLLIIHGTGETNTHLQITEGLVDRLIELGKPFDYMAYPNRNHGLREGKGTSLHLRILMARYLFAHLPPGPR
jgi:dipeptidyl-peptidase-4